MWCKLQKARLFGSNLAFTWLLFLVWALEHVQKHMTEPSGVVALEW